MRRGSKRRREGYSTAADPQAWHTTVFVLDEVCFVQGLDSVDPTCHDSKAKPPWLHLDKGTEAGWDALALPMQLSEEVRWLHALDPH